MPSVVSPDRQAPAASHVAGRKNKTMEQIYQKKTQLEHILLRPDTYVGSVEPQMQEMWVYDDNPGRGVVEQNGDNDGNLPPGSGQMVNRKITYVPALFKIFDEILVNAADHLQRSKDMNMINVTINRETGMISVLNNGDGLPVYEHKEHKCYIPEMLFGHLLTSDNYDDDEKKVTGGRNGFGAKLTNVFSTKFIIETANKKKRYQQIFQKNMTVKNAPEISAYKKEDYTRVTFYPDFARFGMTGLDDDIVALFTKRVYDIAATTHKRCRVYLNEKQIPIRGFEDYCKWFVKSTQRAEEMEGKQVPPILYENCGERWEIAVTLSTTETFQQCSFVNSINTSKGGTHVDHVSSQLIDHIIKKANAQNKRGLQIKPAHVKQHLWLFVNSLIENPAFDSQTKECLKTQPSKLGSKCTLSDDLIKKVLKSGVIDMILSWAKAKEKVDLGRKMKGATGNAVRILGVPKLEDANEAGGKNSEKCTLILTEGDSAKALAVAGLSVLGRDHYGVFPLRGKVMNVRECSHKMITSNQEIQHLLKIMGLTPNMEYKSLNQLRYGSLMIMTDQDLDGSHIKGLLINMVQVWWPSLMQHKGFLKEFVTPIVKVHKGGKNAKTFYTLKEYEEWKKKFNNGKGWDIKYYKGLGTSTAKEAKEYFKDLAINQIDFEHDDRSAETIDLAFSKTRADDRKDWMNAVDEELDVVNHNIKTLKYSDFVNKELVHFSRYAVQRAVPSVVDGFKPGQRKIMFCAFKKKIKKDIKVAQFVGYVSEKGAYHHGEKSLEDAIVNMAQDFVGSNNLNLLFPSGQFGTRLAGGSDHASARYIFTRLMPYTRSVFHELDDNVLNYNNEEGQWIEPTYYVPVIPMALVNGASGIGMGWSTSIPNFNPIEIIDNLKKYLRGQQMSELFPWYRGHFGDCTESDDFAQQFISSGIIRKVSPTQLEILELPVQKWTSDYKEFIESLMPGASKAAAEADAAKKDDKKPKKEVVPQEPLIMDYREYHTENSVHFILRLTEEQMNKVEADGLEKTFKLRQKISTTNMMLFDRNGKIRRYETALDILEEFAIVRMEYYQKRKNFLVDKLNREKVILDAKTKFILMILAGTIEVRGKKKKDLVTELLSHNFKPMCEIQKGKLGTMPDAEKEGGGDEDEEEETNIKGGKRKSVAKREEDEKEGCAVKPAEFDYLLGMPLWNLTAEKVEELKRQLQEKSEELLEIERTSHEQMWDTDLSELRAGIIKDWDQIEKEEEKLRKQRQEKMVADSQKALSAAAKKAAAKGKARAKKVTMASLMAVDDDDESSTSAAPQKPKDPEDCVFIPKENATLVFQEKRKKIKLEPIFEGALINIDLEDRKQYVASRYVSDRADKKPQKKEKKEVSSALQSPNQMDGESSMGDNSNLPKTLKGKSSYSTSTWAENFAALQAGNGSGAASGNASGVSGNASGATTPAVNDNVSNLFDALGEDAAGGKKKGKGKGKAKAKAGPKASPKAKAAPPGSNDDAGMPPPLEEPKKPLSFLERIKLQIGHTGTGKFEIGGPSIAGTSIGGPSIAGGGHIALGAHTALNSGFNRPLSSSLGHTALGSSGGQTALGSIGLGSHSTLGSSGLGSGSSSLGIGGGGHSAIGSSSAFDSLGSDRIGTASVGGVGDTGKRRSAGNDAAGGEKKPKLG